MDLDFQGKKVKKIFYFLFFLPLILTQGYTFIGS